MKAKLTNETGLNLGHEEFIALYSTFPTDMNLTDDQIEQLKNLEEKYNCEFPKTDEEIQEYIKPYSPEEIEILELFKLNGDKVEFEPKDVLAKAKEIDNRLSLDNVYLKIIIGFLQELGVEQSFINDELNDKTYIPTNVQVGMLDRRKVIIVESEGFDENLSSSSKEAVYIKIKDSYEYIELTQEQINKLKAQINPIDFDFDFEKETLQGAKEVTSKNRKESIINQIEGQTPPQHQAPADPNTGQPDPEQLGPVQKVTAITKLRERISYAAVIDNDRVGKTNVIYYEKLGDDFLVSKAAYDIYLHKTLGEYREKEVIENKSEKFKKVIITKEQMESIENNSNLNIRFEEKKIEKEKSLVADLLLNYGKSAVTGIATYGFAKGTIGTFASFIASKGAVAGTATGLSALGLTALNTGLLLAKLAPGIAITGAVIAALVYLDKNGFKKPKKKENEREKIEEQIEKIEEIKEQLEHLLEYLENAMNQLDAYLEQLDTMTQEEEDLEAEFEGGFTL